MNIILSNVEVIFLLVFYNIIINKKFFKNINIIIIIFLTNLLGSIIFSAFNINLLLLGIIIIGVCSIIMCKVDNKKIELCVMWFTLGDCILILVEYIVITISMLLKKGIGISLNEKEIIYLIVCLMCIVIFSTYKLCSKKNISVENKVIEYNGMIFSIINILFMMVFVKYLYEYSITTVDISSVIFLIILINLYFCHLTYKKYKKKKSLEIQNNYNPIIDELVANLRAKEHEYKNHLNMLYALVQVSNPDDIKKKVMEYVGQVNSEDSLNKLLRVDNSIIKAVIYSKIIEAEKRGYDFKYEITSELENVNLTETEITVILSNLINNAFEAVEKCDDRYVELIIEEDDGEQIIEMKNSVVGLKESDLEKIFKRGVSSKGMNRGYGLYNIKNIVEKHQGIIQPYLEHNILVITITFP